MQYLCFKIARAFHYRFFLYLLLIIEISIGIGLITYSANIYFSIRKQEESISNQKYNWQLSIYGDNTDNDVINTQDILKLQQITNKKTLVFLHSPMNALIDDQFYSYNLLLIDYDQWSLNHNHFYIGSSIRPQMLQSVDIPLNLTSEALPFELDRQSMSISPQEEIAFSDSIVMPWQELPSFQQYLYPTSYTLMWSEQDFTDFIKVKSKLELYFQQNKINGLSYEITEPSLALHKATEYSKDLLDVLTKGSILALSVFILGISAVLRIIFLQKKISYGICLASGANHKQILLEIGGEVGLLWWLGIAIGMLVGTWATKNILFGYLPFGIQATPQYLTYVYLGMLGLILHVFSTFLLYRKISCSKLIDLIRYYE